MKPETVEILCSPVSRERLQLVTESHAGGRRYEALVASNSGQTFPLRNGIPMFVTGPDISGPNKTYQALYDRIAPVYDLSVKLYAFFKGGGEEKRRREYLGELKVRPGARVLEVSVGTGRNLRLLPAAAEYFGIDLSWAMLKRCQRNVRKWGLDVELFFGLAERLPFADEAFDVIFHVGGINFFSDRSAAIREMIRVAKAGTKIVIVDETEELARKDERIPVSGKFYRSRSEAISAPVNLVPADMRDVRVENVCGGDLYCLSFRKPR